MDIYTHLAQTLDALPNGFPSTRDGNSEIYLTNPDGSQLVRATNNPASDSEPAWSPDGKQIAFLSNRDGNIDIYLLDAATALQGLDDRNARQITNSSKAKAGPVWMPVFP